MFKIVEIVYTNPITYKLRDLNDEEIEGSFYEQELQKTKQQLYRIEKVLKKKGDKMLVKWKGYSDKFNCWIHKTDVA